LFLSTLQVHRALVVETGEEVAVKKMNLERVNMSLVRPCYVVLQVLMLPGRSFMHALLPAGGDHS
jgi:hypothetical protein